MPLSASVLTSCNCLLANESATLASYLPPPRKGFLLGALGFGTAVDGEASVSDSCWSKEAVSHFSFATSPL